MTGRARRDVAAAAVVGLVLGVAMAWTTRGALLDDAFISLDYARNVAAGGCWCVNTGMPSNTATSPLWVLLLSLPMLALGPVAALGAASAVAMAMLAGTVAALAHRLGLSTLAGPLAAVLVATSPLMQASIGLESLLAVALIALGAHEVAAGRIMTIGVVAGALVLVRPDLAIVSVVLIAVRWRYAAMTVPIAAVAVAPWLVVSLLWFGTVLPDTLIWKQSQSEGLGGHFFGDAVIVFARIWPAVTWLGMGAGVAGFGAGLWLFMQARSRGPVVALGVGAAAHLSVLWTLHVAPYPWYPAPAAGVGMTLLALSVATPASGRWLGLAASAVLVVTGGAYSARHDYVALGSPLNYNRATPSQYAAIVDQVPTGAVVESADELGAFAFFCGDRCAVLDPLSDRGRLAPILSARLASSPALRMLYPGYEPDTPRRADHRVVLGKGGVTTFSGYGGTSTMDVRPNH
ncbi:hypothetical protein [Actinomycetospora termitidis]|uniref:Glycosyltransferase RgtA/B/C/D-like domain-containing protein n=1 Tax=Actinomycetospora termitidis TaxID=3053470 RepID=A0ABT7M1Y2_9PSEU|nr:hypothetical protein [Actinomycetospora sp. Odt1-22]MDL5154673.1 hypothetical protein [Actinomycetospora sp. Odt1-22]